MSSEAPDTASFRAWLWSTPNTTKTVCLVGCRAPDLRAVLSRGAAKSSRPPIMPSPGSLLRGRPLRHWDHDVRVGRALPHHIGTATVRIGRKALLRIRCIFPDPSLFGV